jgi:hypothetical protein
MAVGTTGTSGAPALNAAPLAERWDGTSWSKVSMPEPSGSSVVAIPLSVSCPLSTMCLAAGFYTVGGVGTGSLVETWNGSTWTLQSFAYPSAELLSVSCLHPTSCMAVGQFGFQTFAIRWDGSEWIPQHTPNPTTPIPGAGFNAVGCSATPAPECEAVGTYSTGDLSSSTFGASWIPGKWTSEYTPSPGNNAALNGVSCASTTMCVAVGYHPVPSVGSLPLFGLWNGSSWSILTAPLVRGSMTGVSCVTTTDCTAVGGTRHGKTLVEVWDGIHWTVQGSPSP